MKVVLSLFVFVFAVISCTQNSNSIKDERENKPANFNPSEHESLPEVNVKYCIEYKSPEIKNYNLLTDTRNTKELNIKLKNNKMVIYYVPEAFFWEQSKLFKVGLKLRICKSSHSGILPYPLILGDLYGYD